MTKLEPENFCATPRRSGSFLEAHHLFYGTYSKGLTGTLVDVVVHFVGNDQFFILLNFFMHFFVQGR